jgi:Holliday junction resolvase RusA-like endonuclease
MQQTSLTFQLDGVPIVSKKNKMKVGRGRVYKPKDVTDFEDALAKAASEVVCQIDNWQPLTGNLQMELHVQFPDRRRRDLHNCFDTICDALQDIVYLDDNQIFQVFAKKSIGKTWSLTVTITEI